ncbi:unnamed protein product [Rotaria sp. Silwood2]|nr:unnamed protein product [Rotaria sp. Silwood2]CAF4065445.1 unnamed protein product [Rotaria sp. Silwood2]CAF4322052.1 unnamed protein product [Rotaria sp. Silwood2]
MIVGMDQHRSSKEMDYMCIWNSCVLIAGLSLIYIHHYKYRIVDVGKLIIRLEIGDILCGLSRGGARKFLGALNLPPPVQEQRYGEAQEFILHHVTKTQEESMTAAVEEVIVEVGDVRELTVSEDGAWLTQGYSSVHEIAALCSTTSHPKVLDTTWSSKKNSECQEAESLRYANPDLFLAYQENHDCQLNYTGNLVCRINYLRMKISLFLDNRVE